MLLPPIRKRQGSLLPLLAISLTAFVGMLALAIDLGILILAKTQCQNAADVAAMAAVRQLNGDSDNNNNLNAAQPTALTAVGGNQVLGTTLDPTAVNVSVGWYAYDSNAARFNAHFSGSKPTNESWSAVQVTVQSTRPTFFGRIFQRPNPSGGVQQVSSFDAAATAVAVHRPRDLAIILDFSGSMAFSTETGYPSSGDLSGSLNPDNNIPRFGHWSTTGYQNVMRKTTNYVDSKGQIHAPNNLTIETQNGPPLVNDFLTKNAENALTNAFVRVLNPYDPLTWACPAPLDWDVQADTTVTYWGDRWPRFNMSFTSGSYAATVREYLEGTNTTYNNKHARDTTFETNGYGADFKGYSMGPGYYGKTFYMWPPDPRASHDWRKRFFWLRGTTTPVDDNTALWDSNGYWRQANQTGTYEINYNAIVAWLKAGPQVLPSNLRAGRVLYYSSIPDTIPSSGGSEDQRFWRNYINYVIGAGNSTQQKRTLYGRHGSGWGTVRVTAKASLLGPDDSAGTGDEPYMHYNDNPIRPRLHFWFGPLTMLSFLNANNDSNLERNWLPGTCHEAQCWQLKAGVQSALADIERNHPNDWATLIYFSDLNGYLTPRVTLGRSYTKMRDALFFPFNQLNTLSNLNAEVRPYNSSFNSTAAGNIPNAAGGTSPEPAIVAAYNQLSSYSGFSGRRGAAKVVIFETDGIPNTPAKNLQMTTSSPENLAYYSSYAIDDYVGDNDATVMNRVLDAVDQLVASNTANPPGHSSGKMPVRVHAIGFGDLFSSGTTAQDDAEEFLLDVQKHGNTSPANASSIESYKIITGDFNTRIENLRLALERIMQSGVQVSLIR